MVGRVLMLLLAACVCAGQRVAQAQESVAASDDTTMPAVLDEEPAASGEAIGEPRVSMEFEDAELKRVLKSFSQQSGINVIAVEEVGERPVTVYLDEVTVLDALDQILRAANLMYERPEGSDIYLVKPRPEATQVEQDQTITRVYRLKYARVSKSILAKAAVAFGAKTPYEADLARAPSAAAAASGKDEIGIDTIIKELLTEKGQVIVDGRTNSLIVTDIAANFPRLEAALASLDVRTPQIMVDAEILETTLTKLKDLGVEWGTGSEGTLFQFIPARRETRFPFFGGTNDLLTYTGSLTSRGTTITDPAMQVGFVDSSQAVAVLQALETDGETKILARPKVLTLDNESALIRLTSDEAIGFETANQSQTGTTTSEPERTTTGIVLVVTPQVNEGGYVTMIVEPSVTKTVASQISPPSGQATPRDPKTRSSRAMLRIRSGDTLVVGGLIDRSEATTVHKVPLLADLPFIGELFKNTEVNNSASELIVFVTPRVLAESASAVAAAPVAPWRPAQVWPPLPFLREQDAAPEEAIETTLNRLEQSSW